MRTGLPMGGASSGGAVRVGTRLLSRLRFWLTIAVRLLFACVCVVFAAVVSVPPALRPKDTATVMPRSGASQRGASQGRTLTTWLTMAVRSRAKGWGFLERELCEMVQSMDAATVMPRDDASKKGAVRGRMLSTWLAMAMQVKVAVRQVLELVSVSFESFSAAASDARFSPLCASLCCVPCCGALRSMDAATVMSRDGASKKGAVRGRMLTTWLAMAIHSSHAKGWCFSERWRARLRPNNQQVAEWVYWGGRRV
ncbi:unnamed protein product [Closterium sp. NIES-53]